MRSGLLRRFRRSRGPGDAEILLHIGAPKTGSSAIQYFANSNAEKLASKGLHYPTHGVDANRISGGHAGIGAALLQDRKDDARTALEQHLAAAREYRATLLLSAESLYDLPRQAAELTRGTRTRVLVYFRDPFETILSSYGQLVKRHYLTQTLQEYVTALLNEEGRAEERFRISGLILQDWQKAFGSERLHVFPFDRGQMPGGRVEADFALRLGLRKSELRDFNWPASRINRSYAPTVLELKRLINHLLDHRVDSDLSVRFDSALQKYSDARDWRGQSLEELLGIDLSGELRAHFRSSNELIDGMISKVPPKVRLDDLLPPARRRSLPPIASSWEGIIEEALASEPELIEVLKSRAGRLSASGHSLRDVEPLAAGLGL